jgi:hypothetical protein
MGVNGKRPLIAIGVNPSTADETKPDMTISKIMGFAKRNGFDGFIMLNLYPQRATNPDCLDDEIDSLKHTENLHHFKKLIYPLKEVSILAAWGQTILKRDYLKSCLIDINDLLIDSPVRWLKIGDLSQSGHPRHPSRAAYDLGLLSFDLKHYLNEF